MKKIKNYIRKKIFNFFKKEIFECAAMYHNADVQIPTVVSVSCKIDSSVFGKIGSDELDSEIKSKVMASFNERLKADLFKRIDPYISVYEFNESSFPLQKGVKNYVAEILVIEPKRKRKEL